MAVRITIGARISPQSHLPAAQRKRLQHIRLRQVLPEILSHDLRPDEQRPDADRQGEHPRDGEPVAIGQHPAHGNRHGGQGNEEYNPQSRGEPLTRGDQVFPEQSHRRPTDRTQGERWSFYFVLLVCVLPVAGANGGDFLRQFLGGFQ